MEAVLESAYGNYKFAEILRENESITYRLENNTGRGAIECHEIFPGIQISYNSLHMDTCFQKIEAGRHFWEIDYCTEGCYEIEVNHSRRLFLGERMTSVTALDCQAFTDSRVPLKRFEGIAFLLEPDRIQPVLDREFSGSAISLYEIEEMLDLAEQPFLIKPQEETERIFHELELAREKRGAPYFWLKVVELLMFLNGSDIKKSADLHNFSAATEEAAKAVFDYICAHPFSNLTLPELAGQFHINESSLKRCFKYITGRSIGAFRKEKRMEEAAAHLLTGDETVGEIAEYAGYENQGKFSAAFKSVYHETPLNYRRSRR